MSIYTFNDIERFYRQQQQRYFKRALFSLMSNIRWLGSVLLNLTQGDRQIVWYIWM